MSIIRIAHTSHNPAVSLSTAGACDTVEQIFPSDYGKWYNADPNMHMCIRSDVTTLSIIALTSRRFSKT